MSSSYRYHFYLDRFFTVFEFFLQNDFWVIPFSYIINEQNFLMYFKRITDSECIHLVFELKTIENQLFKKTVIFQRYNTSTKKVANEESIEKIFKEITKKNLKEELQRITEIIEAKFLIFSVKKL